MRLTELPDIRPEKIAELKDRIARLSLDLSLVDEQFVRGGGKGGQKLNKTSNCVLLRYPPLELVVRCARDRRRSVNRFLALRELVDRIELRTAPADSKRLAEFERLRRRKSRRRARGRARSASAATEASASDTGTQP